MPQDARSRPRQPLRRAATLTLIDGSSLAGWTIDLSHGGVSVLTEGRIRLAQYCAVRIETGARPLLVMGQVVYCDADGSGAFRSGISFIQVDAAAVQAIADLLLTA